MKISFLKLLNFRNYHQLEIRFHPYLNVIYGKNGTGKTNLVEAIYVLALTRSFRLVGDKTLIMDNTSISKVEGEIDNRYLTNYRVLLSREGKKVKINNKNVAKLSDYIAKITIVLFHPDDLRIIKDTPSTRRKNLNISISEITIQYLRYLNDYNKIMKQRNSYLKQMLVNHNNGTNYLDILTSKLLDYGYYLYLQRKDYIEKVNQYLSNYYERITGDSGLVIQYLSDYENKTREELLSLYQQGLEKDLILGKTLLGIHKDDLQFLLKGKDLKEYGSEGQQKNAIIAYKFSELEIFKEMTGSYPILILDDLFSELDEEKKDNIMHLLNKEVQTFITTTNIHQFDEYNLETYKQIHIENGKVLEESVHERRK